MGACCRGHGTVNHGGEREGVAQLWTPACQCAARVLRCATALSGGTPPFPPLRQQLWALGPDLDGASEGVANAGGFQVLLGSDEPVEKG